MDNLNLRAGHYGQHLGPLKGTALWTRFIPHDTPKHGSWLNVQNVECGIRQGAGAVYDGTFGTPKTEAISTGSAFEPGAAAGAGMEGLCEDNRTRRAGLRYTIGQSLPNTFFAGRSFPRVIGLNCLVRPGSCSGGPIRRGHTRREYRGRWSLS
jgi:hypothetical protein